MTNSASPSPASPFHIPGLDDTEASWRVGILSSIIRGVSENLPTTGVLAVGLAQGWKLAMSGNSLMFTAGVLVGCLFGAKAGIENWELGVKSSKLFDAPETKGIIAQIAALADDVSSVQKGTIWLVKRPSDSMPSIMSQAEYTKFKKQLAAESRHLDEIKIDGKGVTVRRFVGAGLDAGDRELPAFERFELSKGTVERAATGWFSKGRKVTPEFVASLRNRRDEAAVPV